MALQGGSKTFTGVDIVNQSGTQNVHMGDSIHVHATGDELWSNIKSWIFMPNFALDQTSLHNRTQREKKEKSTGQWLLESTDFTHWKDKPNSVMWLRGKMGCGKTMLCSSVARQLIYERSNRASVTVAHYYITVTDPQTQGFDILLRSLIYQIGASTEITRKMAEKYYNNADRGNREPYLDELYDLLRNLLTLQRSIFIIIDALDEGRELDTTLEFIETLVDWNIPGMHLLISSRELPSVRHTLLALRPTVEPFSVEVMNAEVKLDIQRHLRKELEKGRRRWSEKDQQRIIDDLVQSSEGIFRYISVPLSDISRCRTPKELYHVLDTLPKTLNGTYESFLRTVRSADQERAKRILESVTLSRRSLTLAELAHTIPVNSCTKPYFDESVQLCDPTEILDICGPLIAFEDFSELENSWEDIALDTDRVAQDLTGDHFPSTLSKIRLAHSSVKEYLLGDTIKESTAKFFSINENDSALTMAEILLAYGVHVGTSTSSVTTDSVLNHEWPLFQYAVDNWYSYADEAKDIYKSKIESLLLEIRHSTPYVYRSLTYPQPSTPFNPLAPPIPEPTEPASSRLHQEQAGTRREHHHKAGICSACEQLKLEDLKNPQLHPWNFQQLRASAGSRCPMCNLMLNSLVYQWISRRANQWPILTESDTTKAEITASETIASNAESSNILLYFDPTGDPFLIVQCLHLIGRLGFEYPAGRSTLKGPITPPECFSASGALIPKISQWLRTCESQHISCTATPSFRAPFLLVDVGDDSRKPRLVWIDHAPDVPDRYTTLLFWWERRGPRNYTSRTNLAERCSSIPVEAIPQVMVDAITLTRSLGIRFIWVDKLCALADEDGEFIMAARDMSWIYANSYLNIVSGAPDGSVSLQTAYMNICRFGDCHLKDESTDLTIKWPGREAFYKMCDLSLEYYPNSWHFGPRNHHLARLFQEIKLAPRNLVFQVRESSLRTEEVYMQCKERVVWESGLERCRTLVKQTDEQLDWYRTIEFFSGLKVYSPYGRIILLSITARSLTETFGREYAAGLWITDLVRGLLWYRPQPSYVFRSSDRLTPTWSWASAGGLCVHYWPNDVVSMVKTVRIREQPNGADIDDPEESFERITRRFSLIIEAPLIRIDWSLCNKTRLEHTYNIGCDQAQNLCLPLRASCWFDTEDGTPNAPEHCVTPIFMLQLTRRAGLLLRKGEIDLEADKESFIRVGLFVVAKSTRNPFEGAETRQIVIA